MESNANQAEQTTADHFGIRAPAKINLSLDVLGRAENGYHYISSLICPSSLADDVTVVLSDSFKGVKLEVALSKQLEDYLDGLELDRAQTAEAAESLSSARNLAFKAAAAYLASDHCALGASGVQLRLLKRIPFGAGLGGGSADAAAVLRALNHLSPQPMDMRLLSEIAASLGADVPAQLRYSLVHVSGFGEVVQSVQLHPPKIAEGIGVVVVVPPRMVSTPEAYNLLGFRPGDKAYQKSVKKEGVSSSCSALFAEAGGPAASTKSVEESEGLILEKVGQPVDEHASISLTFGAEADTSGKPDGAAYFSNITRIIGNSFDRVISTAYPEIGAVRSELKRLGAETISMTGSGSALCCYFPTLSDADGFAERLASEASSNCFVSSVRLLPDAFYWAVAKW